MKRGDLSDYYEVLRFVIRTLFYWRGRIDRKTYWLIAGVVLFWALVCHRPVMYLLWTHFAGHGWQGSRAFVYFEHGVSVLLLFIRVVVTCKRLHDFNASGWWALVILAGFLAFVPEVAASFKLNLILALGEVAFFIVCCAVNGTDGANRFGEKPTRGGWKR